MAKREKTLNAVIGDVIRGRFTTFGLTIEDLAERTQIPYGTLRKKIIGTSPIHVTELLEIAAAIDESVTAESITNEAQAIWARMSAAAPKNELQQKRIDKEAEARAMSPDQLDQVPRRAATTDPDLEQDEPQAP